MNALPPHPATRRRGRLAATLTLVSIAALTPATPARAFDDVRKGFVLEFGLGPSLATRSGWNYDETTSGLMPAGSMHLAGATRFRLGVGLSDHVALQYVNDLAMTLDDTWLYDDAFTMSALTGIGASWTARAAAPSWIVEAAVGMASSAMPGASSSDRESGFGFEGAVGYEFAPHWRVSFVARHLDLGESAMDRSACDLVVSRAWY